MRGWILRHRSLRCLLALCFVLSSDTAAQSPQCRPPQHRIGPVLADSSSELIMNISMLPQEFSASRLVCLATALRASYRGRSSVIVSIFDSPEAASYSWGFLTDLEDTKEAMDAFAHLHARYVFSAGRNEDYVETIPMHDPYSRKEIKEYNTRINLPSVDIPPCDLQINGRCLLTLNNVAYPYKALVRGGEGKGNCEGNDWSHWHRLRCPDSKEPIRNSACGKSPREGCCPEPCKLARGTG
jgi:hypothetical protein